MDHEGSVFPDATGAGADGPRFEIDGAIPRRRAVVGHQIAVPFFLTAEMFGGLPVEVAGGDISGLVGAPVARRHVHDVPEIYLLVSTEPGDTVIDVQVGDDWHEVRSPAAVYVPAGTPHQFVTRVATKGSFCFGIFIGAGEGTGAAG